MDHTLYTNQPVTPTWINGHFLYTGGEKMHFFISLIDLEKKTAFVNNLKCNNKVLIKMFKSEAKSHRVISYKSGSFHFDSNIYERL